MGGNRAERGSVADGVPGILGIHIEGPILSLEKKGVHDASKLPELDDNLGASRRQAFAGSQINGTPAQRQLST